MNTLTIEAQCKQQAKQPEITRNRLIALLNEDLAGEYQAIIAYVVYSQILEGTAYRDIARQLERHAAEEFRHVVKTIRQIDDLGGVPCAMPRCLATSTDPSQCHPRTGSTKKGKVLRSSGRFHRAKAMGEFGLSEVPRAVIVQQQARGRRPKCVR